MATTKITARPNDTVSNPSIERANSNSSTAMTAKWKVPSSLTKASSKRRATLLKVVWTAKWLAANGKEYTRDKVQTGKSINSTSASFDPRDFTDSKGDRWSTSDFWPAGPRRLISVSFKVYAGNKINGKAGYSNKGAGTSYSFGLPGAPAISALEHDKETGEIFFKIDAYDGSKSTAPRIRTAWQATVYDTRKTGSARTTKIPAEPGTFVADSKTWDEDTPDADKVVIDVTDRYLLGPNEYVSVTISATTESVRHKNSSSSSIVIAYPNAATLGEITVDKLDSGAANMSGRVTVEVTTNSTNNKPTTGIRLQKLVSTTATTPEQATAMGNDWVDTDAIDDGECDGLSLAVAELSPTRGTHTWIRTKSWNSHEDLFYTYSVPKEVTDLYVDPASASDNLRLLSLTSGDDGTSLVADFAWTQGHDPDTGTEVTWSSDEKAWMSTQEPDKYETDRNDGAIIVGVVSNGKIAYGGTDYTITSGAVTIGGKSYKVVPLVTTVTPAPASVCYVGTLRVYIQELDQGETYYVRGRRYLDSEDTDRSYGGYSETLTAIPVSSPTAVVLSSPQTIARGSNLSLSWTFDSEALQKEWYLLYGTEYTVVDPETGEREYVIGEDAWLANGSDAFGSCVVKWSDLEPRLDENGELGLALRMGTGGTLVTSSAIYIRVVEPPRLTAEVAGTITAQQFPVTLSCNVMADVTLILRAGSYGEDGMTGGNGGDGLVHDDQTAGDVVWQQYLTPAWTEDNGTYTVTITAPIGLELLDGGVYTLFVQPNESGLTGETVVLPLAVAWANQAPRMSDGDYETPITVTPLDETDEEGVRTRQCTIALAPPTGALGNESYNVYRVTPDGVYLIAGGCGLNETVVDPYAPYGGEETAYRVAIVTADGDVDWLDYGYSMEGRDLRVDFGDTYVELPWNLSMVDGYEKDFEARRKLDGSIDGYWNSGVMRTGGFDTDLIRITEQSKAIKVRELARHVGPAFVRTPDGCAYQANVSVDSIGGARMDAALAVQLEATEVDLTDEFRAELPDRGEDEEEEP